MANKKQKKQPVKKTGLLVFKKLLIILLILGMLGMYIVMPLMAMGA